jgi:hypothetical protein
LKKQAANARLQAGAARRRRVDDDHQPPCARSIRRTSSPARRQRPGAAYEYVVIRRTGITLVLVPRLPAIAFTTARRTTLIGVAGLLELARAFTKVSPAPKRSILFLSLRRKNRDCWDRSTTPSHRYIRCGRRWPTSTWTGLNVHGKTKD